MPRRRTRRADRSRQRLHAIETVGPAGFAALWLPAAVAVAVVAGNALASAGTSETVAVATGVAVCLAVAVYGIGFFDPRFNVVAGWRRPLLQPRDVAVLADGTLALADTEARLVVLVGPAGDITWRGGHGMAFAEGDDHSLRLNAPFGLAAAPDGALLIADTFHTCVWRLHDGKYKAITPLPVELELEERDHDEGEPPVRYPVSVAVDAAGRVYVAEAGNDRVRRLEEDGSMRTVAGTGARGFGGDGGPATAAQLASPHDVAVAEDGRLLIADRLNHRVRSVSPEGRIDTVAGTGLAGDLGDGGPAGEAQLCFPSGVAIGADGTIYVADDRNRRVRAIDPRGRIATPFELDVAGPTRVRVAPGGGLHVVDTDGQRVWHVAADGSATSVLAERYAEEPSPQARRKARLAGALAPLGVLVVFGTLIPVVA